MSMQRKCFMYLAADGQWYMKLGNFEHAYDDRHCTNYGPFPERDAAEKYLLEYHVNPGGWSWDDAGTREPPDVVHPPTDPYSNLLQVGPG